MTELENSTELSGNIERVVDRHSVAIVTATRYLNWYAGALKNIVDTDKVRGDLALEAISTSLGMGYQTVVVDGNSNFQFREKLLGTGVKVLDPDLGVNVSQQRRKGIKSAVQLDGTKVICTTEPEKVSLIADCMGAVVKPILEGNADIVVPRRNPDLQRATYPDYQYEYETKGVKTYNKVLRLARLRKRGDLELDMIFGPIAFRNTPSVSDLFMKIYELTGNSDSNIGKYMDPERYSNTLLYPVINALQQGLNVVSVEVPFRYPTLQRQNEEAKSQKDRRRTQKFGLVGEEIALVRHMLGKQKGLQVREKA